MTNPTDKVLVVPIHVAVLRVGEQHEDVLAATANFSRLPHRENGYRSRVKQDGPYISDVLLAERAGRPSKGVHLHWALPEALRKGIINDRSKQIEFPTVPNRWRITRIIYTSTGQARSSRSWILESDRLNKNNPNPDTSVWPPTVTVPVFAEDAQDEDIGCSQNFRYLGEYFDISEWQKQQNQVSSNLEYLNQPRGDKPSITPYKLTAMGYGDPNFASFYPNCCSVFGFCDTAASLRAANYQPEEKLGYSVIGWYSDPNADPAKYLSFKYAPPTDDSEEDREEYLRSGLQLGDKQGCYNSDYKWFFESSGLVKPIASLYNGVVQAFNYKDSDQYIVPNEVRDGNRIIVGNTPSEALSALLASRLHLSDGDNPEQLLNALQLGILNQIFEPDGIEKVRRTLHANSFNSQSGGTQWKIASKQRSDSAQTDLPEEVRLALPELIEKANNLNHLEYELSQLERQLTGLRQQLMADWRKYLYIRRTPQAQMIQGSVPQKWITGDAIDTMAACLESLMAIISKGEEEEENIDPIEEKVREKQGEIDDVKADIERTLVSKSLDQYYELVSGPAPQYYLPNEPTVLLSGAGVKPPEHYGKLSRRDDGFLECDINFPTDSSTLFSSLSSVIQGQLQVDTLDSARSQAIVTYVDALLKQACLIASGVWAADRVSSPRNAINSASNVDVWLPLMMEWIIDERPREQLQLDNTSYKPGIITSNYYLDLSTGDFTAKVKEPDSGLRNTYTNRVPLAVGATISLQYQIDQYLQQLEEEKSLIAEQLKELRQKLVSENLLVQTLGGFNSALIMRKETYQLPIYDPIYTNIDYEKSLADAVRDCVQQDGNLGENSGGGFSPLRAGLMQLNKIRVLDCFGRKIDLEQNATPIVSDSLSPSDKILQNNGWIKLAPRIVPPSRLLLNWIPARGEKIRPFSRDEDPICGWVMFNYLDKSLQIYDPQGFALGSILFVMRDGKAQVHWQGQPGTVNWDKTLTQVMETQNETFRALVERVSGDSQYTCSFFEMLNSSLALSPNKVQDDANPLILIGKPLAVVRAWMKFEVNGNFFPLSQRWEELQNKDWDDDFLNRNNQVLCGVNLPVRLGELIDVEDGLVGFFKHNDQGAIDTDKFYAAGAIPPGKTGSHSDICRPTDQTLLLKADPGSSQIVTMLIDPYSKVNVATGLLPAQTLELSQEFYIKALQQIKATFLVSPILGPQNSKFSPSEQQLPMIVPNESLHQGSWSWLERRLNSQNLKSWQTRKPISTDLAEVISYSPQILREGWLLLSHETNSQQQPPQLRSRNLGIQVPDPILPPAAYLPTRRRFHQRDLVEANETPSEGN